MSSSEGGVARAPRGVDLGLLVLRVAFGVGICVIYGIPKVQAAVSWAHTGHWAFVDFNRRVGLPLPVVAALVQTLDEAGATLLVAIGLFTRYAALALFVGFTTATACSVIAHEDAWLMAASYAVTFGAIALTGPGALALDAWRARRGAARQGR